MGSCTRNTVTIEGMALCGEAGDVLSTGPLWDEVSTLQCSRAWWQGVFRWSDLSFSGIMIYCSRCAVATESAKAAELARGMGSVLATRYHWRKCLPLANLIKSGIWRRKVRPMQWESLRKLQRWNKASVFTMSQGTLSYWWLVPLLLKTCVQDCSFVIVGM